ncbi:hypothetical protein SAMN04488003_101247 [Loktanella fryxellensis]|uniref:DUF1127 domain-containing protein n=1 Tax=Loktanella fryxellensis TaxID=245187 RepID=A0A1H7YNB8_9RHOB|nr:hypothetical protein [Loktanella fryxellensis]SEM47726.1 hypothetical protein SAMN04488003_101247 [Loktanella fryxellensis]
MTLIDTIRRTIAKRAHYSRTKREIRAMPLDVALDLNIDRADARLIARQAVYG